MVGMSIIESLLVVVAQFTTLLDLELPMLIGAPWLTDGSYEMGWVDYVYSLLLDSQDQFYITLDEQTVFIFLPGHGLIRIIHDFRGMTDAEVNRTIGMFMSSSGD